MVTKEYIECIYNFYEVLFNKAVYMNDTKLRQISYLIKYYVLEKLFDINMSIKDLNPTTESTMELMYDYIKENNIQLYNLNEMNYNDFDVSSRIDKERFVLSHIHYIYTNNKM
jgi:hypothetical protein